LCNQHVACTAQTRCRLSRLYGLINYRYAPNYWCHHVPLWSQQFAFLHFVKELIHSHANNPTHPFIQPMVMPINAKEFDNFFGNQLATFVQISSKTANLVFFVQNAKSGDFVCFSSKTNFLCPYWSSVCPFLFKLWVNSKVSKKILTSLFDKN